MERETDPAKVLAKAYLRAMRNLDIPEDKVEQLIRADDVSEPQVRTEAMTIQPETPAGKNAAQLIRVYAELARILGGDEQKMRDWMSSFNQVLEGKPVDVILKKDGLMAVLAYLIHYEAATVIDDLTRKDRHG